ncbi:MAG: 4'-phosphopantetheinyl transferase EntD [Oceanicoccus sp.]|jgi:4'-phosphopantetheinyl transferase EntD
MELRSLPQHANAFLLQAINQHPYLKTNSRICLQPYGIQPIKPEQWLTQNKQLPTDNILQAKPKRQASYYYGRDCAHKALSNLKCTKKVSMGAFNEPIWPKGFIGSISHTDQLAVAVTIKDVRIKGVGIDIENTLSQSNAGLIFNSVLTSEEASVFESHFLPSSHLNHTQLLTVIFSVKESFYKAAFTRVKRILEYDAIEIFDVQKTSVHYRIKDKRACEQLNISEQKTFVADYRLMGKSIITLALLET